MEALSSAAVTLRVCVSRLFILLAMLMIAACGGGSSSNSPPSINKGDLSSSQIISSSSSFSNAGPINNNSSVPFDSISITGKITYDFVPHSASGLNYAAVEIYPARGVQVELLDEKNIVLATTSTDEEGQYFLNTAKNKVVKVRAKAQLLRTQSPRWNFKVTDNTSNNSLYAISGELLPATDATSIRDLHAPSGWTGHGYTQPRIAAPFAILDSIYIGIERIHAAGNPVDFPPLELRWSIKNKPADGKVSLGEIGTTFFWGDAIYILGDENTDTDEYDRHVLLHEWSHYLEEKFSRRDNFGGDHSFDEKLDMRVAMSEGLANAFSTMILDDAIYKDSGGHKQSASFTYDISRKNNYSKGWFSEASVQSVIHNLYRSDQYKKNQILGDLFRILSSTEYVNHNGFISIYLLAERLRKTLPGHLDTLNTLLQEQNIAVTDEYGLGETNSGGFYGSLPVYKNLTVNGGPIRVCVTNNFGSYNKLSNFQYAQLDIALAGNYQFTVNEAGISGGNSNPDLYLYQRGRLIDFGETAEIGREILSTNLPAGSYTLELTEERMGDTNLTAPISACFDLHVQLKN